jgi:hypothetical protein
LSARYANQKSAHCTIFKEAEAEAEWASFGSPYTFDNTFTAASRYHVQKDERLEQQLVIHRQR